MKFSTIFFVAAALLISPLAAANPPLIDAASADIIDIGGGLFLEPIPAEYVTKLLEPPQPELQWVTIPATYKTITETKIVQPAYTDVEIVPPVYDDVGSMIAPARARVKDIPAVTREVTRRIVDKPAQKVQRLVPYLVPTRTVREKVREKVYIVRDSSGAELKTYTDPETLAKFLNAR